MHYSLIPFLASTAAAAAAAVYALAGRRSAETGRLALVLLAETAWGIGSLIELLSPGIAGKIFGDDLRIASMLLIPLAAIGFALGFMVDTGRPRWFWPALSAAPAAFAALLFTDSFHGLARGPVAVAPFESLVYSVTPIHAFITLYACGMLAAAAAILISRRVRPRIPVLLVVLGHMLQLASVIAALFFAMGGAASMAFAAAGIFTALGSFGFRASPLPAEVQGSMIEGIRDAVVIMDPDGRVTDINPAALALFGRRYKEAVGKPLVSVSPMLAGLMAVHGGEEAFRTGLPSEDRRPAAGYELRMTTMHGALGDVTGRIALIQDITERKRIERELRKARDDCEGRIGERTEELSVLNEELAAEVRERTAAESALRESEEKLRSFIEGSTEGLALVDEMGTVSEWNQSLERISGIRRLDVIGKPFWDVQFSLVPFERQDSEAAGYLRGTWLDALRIGAMPSMAKPTDVTVVTPSGERKTCTLTVFFIKTDKGVRIGSIVLDVTEQRSAEKALRESELRYRALYESSGDAIYLLKKGRVVDCNPRALSMFGRAGREEIVGRFVECAPPPDQETLDPRFAVFLDAAARGEPQAFEWRSARTDGTFLDLEISLNRIFLEGEEIIQEIVRDITGRKKTEADLARYRDGLEDLVRTRTRELEDAHAELVRKERLAALGQVAATVSHEIKNPLGTVKNALFTLGEILGKKGEGRADRALELAERNIRRCDQIIGELLDYARKRTLVLGETDLDAWISGVLSEQQFPPGMEVARTLESGVQARIDQERLRRALVNVVTNAVQAMGEEGARGKRLSVESRVRGNRVEIEVGDEGVGMSAEVLRRLWEPMYSTKPYGVGLGMPVVRAVMDEHGGGVEVSSEEGRGTKVVLWLPLPGVPA
jgi:PAS domain S-box-containing protein